MALQALKEPLVDPSLGQSLIEAASTPQFAQVLLGAARQFDQIDEVFAYQVNAQGQVRVLLSSGSRKGLEERTGAYTQRFHAEDPVLMARAYRDKAGGFTQRVRAMDIPSGDYRDLCFEQPGFQEKLSFGWRDPAQLMVLSFYRGQQAGSESREPQLSALGQVAMSALSYHVRQEKALAPQANARDVLLARLSRSFPNLTDREREIVALSLLGDSAAEIGQALSIKPATVHTFRLRAYARYGFSRASDFLTGLLD